MYYYSSTNISISIDLEQNDFELKRIELIETKENNCNIMLSERKLGYIIYPVVGNIQLQSDSDITIPIGSISVVFLQPEQTNARIECRSYSKLYLITFKHISSRINKKTSRLVHDITHFETDIAVYIQLLYDEFTRKDEEWQIICNAIISILYTKICRSIISEHLLPESQASTPAELIKKYIDDNFTQKLTITSIAQSLFISYSTVCHCFASAYHTSVAKYINEKRIEKSKVLLRETSIPISSIAEKVGFSNLASFYRNFKNITKMSPGDYRNNVEPIEHDESIP